jgi:hypothetical protein
MSEVRMVETGSGVVSASASSVTLRVPIAMGLVCGTAGLSTVISMMPVDSASLVAAAISGASYRQTNGSYVYAEGATTVAAGGSATCTGASITTVPGGAAIQVTPALPAGARAGLPAFIYQQVRYEFAASTSIPGRVALWRTVLSTGASEELAAPFDTASRFRFYKNNTDTSDTVVPPVTQIRGLELSLVGASENPRFGKNTPERASLQTAVFFLNRID